jgi:hypothetical protein
MTEGAGWNFMNNIRGFFKRRLEKAMEGGTKATSMKDLARACAAMQSFIVANRTNNSWSSPHIFKSLNSSYRKDYNQYCWPLNCLGVLPAFDLDTRATRDTRPTNKDGVLEYCDYNGRKKKCSLKIPNPDLTDGVAEQMLLLRCQQCEADEHLEEVFELIDKNPNAVCPPINNPQDNYLKKRCQGSPP